MKNDSNALIQGITYTKYECYQYRQGVISGSWRCSGDYFVAGSSQSQKND